MKVQTNKIGVINKNLKKKKSKNNKNIFFLLKEEFKDKIKNVWSVSIYAIIKGNIDTRQK